MVMIRFLNVQLSSDQGHQNIKAFPLKPQRKGNEKVARKAGTMPKWPVDPPLN